MPTTPTRLDHLVLATPRLAETLDRLEAAMGIRPLAGGTHPAWETRNAILPLSATTYLEVIGPDAVAEGARPTIFHLHQLTAPRLVTWAAKGTDLAGLVATAAARGIALGRVAAGGRVRPDGMGLSWQLTDPFEPRADGLLPFFIDWGASPHPAASAPAVVRLERLHAEHPDPGRLREWLGFLGLDLAVKPGPAPRLVATLSTPKGMVALP